MRQEYYENDPWALWQRLLETLENANHLSPDEAKQFFECKGTGFYRDNSIAALEELCKLLTKKAVQLTKEEFEQIRGYGKRWKAKACWKPLRKQIVKLRRA